MNAGQYPDDRGRSVTRALVLGGGGAVGVAWEAGLLSALTDAGITASAFDVILGTSAGAIVGARYAHGLPMRGASGEGRTPKPNDKPLIDRERLDLEALGEIFKRWAAIDITTPEQAAGIGRIVRTLDRSTEAAFVASLETVNGSWPEQPPLWIAAVDTESGERRLFRPADGVPLARAIAASSAVPGIFPAVEIDGKLYMDGQVHSSTNADVLVPLRPTQVIAALPTNAITGGYIGPHAERMLARETAALEQVGCEVIRVTPSAADGQRLGKNLMDQARAPEAFAVGLEAGRALARQLAP
jgi:NTE family protein